MNQDLLTKTLGATNRFSNCMLIIPDDENEEVEDPVIQMSSRSRVDRQLLRQSYEARAPQRNTLRDLGLKDIEMTDMENGNSLNSGVFAPLSSIGAAAAFFPDEAEMDTVSQRIGNINGKKYKVVPDFPMNIPARYRSDELPATRGMKVPKESQWPVYSGIHQAHELGIRGSGVMIGVLDTGVDADHVEFDGKRINYRYVSLFPHHPQFGSRDIRGFDLDGHGTHVCGIMCGQNIGIAPEAELFVASVIESETTLTSLIRVSAGLNWLLAQFSKPERQYRPAILNISLGFPSSSPGINPTDYQNRLNLMERLIRTLRKFNVLPVCAIGNDGPGTFGYPGAFDRVLGIGAVDFENKVASFSGGGIVGNSLVKPNLVGYGVGIYSSVERDYDGNSIYQRFNGTSMASPYVAGVGALYRCKYPGLNVDRIEELLIGNALVLSGQNNIGNGLAIFKQ